ncbi:hypothetical protein Hanom_Chr05g00407111 [Helianthus anomalus]
MCLAEISSAITNDACHPCLNPKTSKRPSSALASTNPFCIQYLDAKSDSVSISCHKILMNKCYLL